MGKSENYGFFENDCSLRPEKRKMQTTNGVDVQYSQRDVYERGISHVT